MKIVIATPLYLPDIGGPAKYAGGIHDELERLGHAAPVVCYGSGERNLPIGLRHLFYFFRLLPHLSRADCIIAFDTWSVGLPALMAAKLFHKKILVRIGGDFLWESYVERTGDLVHLSEFYRLPRVLSFKERLIRLGTSILLRYADALLFTTVWQREIWKEAYHFTDTRVYIVENEFPPKLPVMVPSRRIFVSAGRDIKLKNMLRVREAFALAKKTYQDIELDARQLPPQEHHSRIEQCYAVVVGSVSEVNPNSLIEAIAAGKPFIAPRDCGLFERARDLGLFVDTLDISELQSALKSLLDPKIYEQYMQRIRQFSFTRSFRDITQEILHIVENRSV